MGHDAARMLLAFVVMPLWVAAGFLDWLCHRRTHIETTSGPKESWLHLLLFAELGVPLLAVLFFEVNALLFAMMLAALAAHQITALRDLHHAVPRRVVSPFEQQVHSALEMMPVAALLLLGVLHWPQLLALFGVGGEAPRYELRLRNPPLSTGYVVGLLACVCLFNALPFLEELLRGLRAVRTLPITAGTAGSTPSHAHDVTKRRQERVPH